MIILCLKNCWKLKNLLFFLPSFTSTEVSSWGKTYHQTEGYSVTFHDGAIKEETGLCVVIPCSFTTANVFSPKYIIWYKCEPSNKKCSDSDIILNSEDSKNVQTGFRGRVSLLQPDVSQKNCSIRIKDLKESDSGSYKLRVVGSVNNWPNGFTYSAKTKLSVTGK